MRLPISKALFAGLLAAGVVSALVALAPPAVMSAPDEDLLPAARPHAASRNEMNEVSLVASRALHAPPSLKNQGYAPPPPPPPPVVISAPVKPTAPSLPFVYLGRMVSDGQPVVFLGKGENVEVARVGEDLEQNWRLEAVDESVLRFRYKPLNEVRQLVTSK